MSLVSDILGGLTYFTYINFYTYIQKYFCYSHFHATTGFLA